MRIAFVTDIHYGRWMGDGAMSRLTGLVMAQQAHLILLGGDLAEGIQAQQRLCRQHLPRMKAEMGVFAVPGNNDYEAVEGDYDRWRQMLGQAEVELLYNRRVKLRAGHGNVVLSGLDESKYGHPDGAVVSAPVGERDLHILMTHSPWALAPVMEQAARVDLALCGHTHGGQIALGSRASMLAMGYRGGKDRPYFFLSGDRTIRGLRVVVSNGVGCSLLPVRLGAPPQIHVIDLI